MIRRLLLTPFGLATLACFVFAGWAVWSAGAFDGPVAAKVRTSSVYAAPGTGLDTAAAEKAIGNRRLVVIMMQPGAKLDDTCHAVRRAAKGTLVVLFARDGSDYDSYGCSQLPGALKKNFGKSVVAETTINDGIDQFIASPLDAVKVMVVHYDQLAKAGIIPDDARTISPSLPRYLAAAAAVGAVVLGSALMYLGAFRTARAAGARRVRRDQATDARTVLSATTAVVAQQIVDLESRYNSAATAQAKRTRAATKAAATKAAATKAATPKAAAAKAAATKAAASESGAIKAAASESGARTGAQKGVTPGLTKQSRRGKLGAQLAAANAGARATGGVDDDPFLTRYRQLTAEYVDLVDDIATADRRDEEDFGPLTQRAETLAADLRKLAS